MSTNQNGNPEAVQGGYDAGDQDAGQRAMQAVRKAQALLLGSTLRIEQEQ